MSRGRIQSTIVLARAACGMAEVDVPWVTSAVTELLLNAIRNAKTTAEVNTALRDNEVRVSVSDDGGGFSGPVNKRFAPSVRRQGLGVSLSLVNDVANAHGGKLIIDPPQSEGKKGGSVHLSFPFLAQAAM